MAIGIMTFVLFISQGFGSMSSKPFDVLDVFMWRGGIGERAGFEIGNGRVIIKNYAGKYQLKIYDKWEVGIMERFTEVISPIYEGIPRARLQINAVIDERVTTVDDLVQPNENSEWGRVFLGDLDGVKKEVSQPNGIHNLEVRLFRGPGDLIVINVDGKPGSGSTATVFDRLQAQLMSFQLFSE